MIDGVALQIVGGAAAVRDGRIVAVGGARMCVPRRENRLCILSLPIGAF
jgi:hypothetical protein